METLNQLLITGPTGNVGFETLRALFSNKIEAGKIICATRNISKAKAQLVWEGIGFREFDFTRPALFESVLMGIETVMLVRPPQITDVNKYLNPFIESCKKAKIKHIVFLSVQGVENVKFIPHAKIEKIIVESGLNYTFIRPSYFMQNFLNDLHNDLVTKGKVFLPAAAAKFNVIDVRDIGAVFSKVILSPNDYTNQSLEITGGENVTFGEMAEILSNELEQKISYQSPSLLKFFIAKRKEGIPGAKIMVMMLLHFMPRLSNKAPRITETIKEVLGKEPIEFKQFVKDFREKLLKE